MKRKIIIGASAIFMAFMAGLFIYFFMKHDTSRWEVALGGILVSGFPLLLLLLKKIPFSTSVIIGYYLFLFCTTFLGSICKFYVSILWWDTALHLYKGLFMGIIAITLFKIFVPKHLQNEVSKWLLFLFVLSLSIVASAIWEIYEFFGDVFYTETMQRGGNQDTMFDLSAGLLGGLIIAVYSLLRRQKI
ncbi:hypothetical protein [Peribacillus kribbensis]|uniref:hypothetical protein n=1 Tax=Peribacillus kribbensis TaxID=356658 RepID=UPI00040A5608|nr:hypothetical protein [Peribacillus kribbensis]